MFYIGQEIVAVADHVSKAFRKGDTFTVKSLKINCCRGFVYDLGIIDDYGVGQSVKCTYCGANEFTDGIWWVNGKNLVPVDYTKAKQVTFEKITEEVPMMAN